MLTVSISMFIATQTQGLETTDRTWIDIEAHMSACRNSHFCRRSHPPCVQDGFALLHPPACLPVAAKASKAIACCWLHTSKPSIISHESFSHIRVTAQLYSSCLWPMNKMMETCIRKIEKCIMCVPSLVCIARLATSCQAASAHSWVFPSLCLSFVVLAYGSSFASPMFWSQYLCLYLAGMLVFASCSCMRHFCCLECFVMVCR
jgi:hypothetical protein